MPNIQYFTPDISAGDFAGPTSAAVALPNPADSLLYLVNLGSCTVYFKLGTTSAVSVTPQTGMALNPGQSLIVGAQGMSYIAMIVTGSLGQGLIQSGSPVNLTSGN